MPCPGDPEDRQAKASWRVKLARAEEEVKRQKEEWVARRKSELLAERRAHQAAAERVASQSASVKRCQARRLRMAVSPFLRLLPSCSRPPPPLEPQVELQRAQQELAAVERELVRLGRDISKQKGKDAKAAERVRRLATKSEAVKPSSGLNRCPTALGPCRRRARCGEGAEEAGGRGGQEVPNGGPGPARGAPP